YFIDVAYCVNPIILWMAIAGIILLLLPNARQSWQVRFTLLVFAAAPFAFYVYSLYSNTVPILMPGLVKDEPASIYNVRYGAIMAASLPIFAAVAVNFVFWRAESRRTFSFLMLLPLMFPNPIPDASQETVHSQLTDNLFFNESVHNQSFWL